MARTPTISQLRRQLVQAETREIRDAKKRLRALEKKVLVLTRSNRTLRNKVDRLERTACRLRKRVRKVSNRPRGRVRQREVSHNISAAEKAHLLRVWRKNRRSGDRLEAEGRKLAQRYNLHLDRQVYRWFDIFENMTEVELRKLSK